MAELAAHLAQILAAALGGLAFTALGIPAAWLSGAVFGVVAWRAFGFGRPMPKPLADAAMLVSGATMGASITPEALGAVARYPASLLILALATTAITASSMLWLTRVSGWRREDALLASAPGALTTVMAIAADRRAAVAPIAVVQSFRLLVLIMVLPSAVVLISDHGASPLGQGRPIAEPSALALALVGGLALGTCFERLRLAAPILLGATVVSTALHAGGWAPGVMPPALSTIGLILVGVFIAERFRSLDLAMLRRTIPAAAGSFLTSLVLALAFSGLVTLVTDLRLADVLVAFAPGGVEAMMMLSIALGLDPLYVGIHHFARFMGLGVALPVVFAWFFGTRMPPGP